MKKRYIGLFIGALFPLISFGLVDAFTELNAGDALIIIAGIFAAIAFSPSNILANVISPDIPSGIVIITVYTVWGGFGFLFGFLFEKLACSHRGNPDTRS